MPQSGEFTTSFRRFENGSETDRSTWKKRRTAKAPAGCQEVNCVCSECNNNWMQDLDNDLRDALAGLAKSQTGTLAPLGCQMLAAWATKISMLIDELWEPVIPLDAKREFGSRQQAPRSWRYWIGLRSETYEENHLRAATLHFPQGSADVKAVVFNFRVMHAAFVVLAPLTKEFVIGGPTSRKPDLWMFWPSVAGFAWPPPENAWIETEDYFDQIEHAFPIWRIASSSPRQ